MPGIQTRMQRACRGRSSRTELCEQKASLQCHMANELMHKMGYVEHEKPRGESCYPATVWEVA